MLLEFCEYKLVITPACSQWRGRWWRHGSRMRADSDRWNKGIQNRQVVDRVGVVGQPKAEKTKTVFILHGIVTYRWLIVHLCFQRFLTASQGLHGIICYASHVCPSDCLISVSFSPSIQETQTAFLPWTTSVGPWQWMASWTEKTHSTQQDSLSLSRWIVEWEADVSADYQDTAIKPV